MAEIGIFFACEERSAPEIVHAAARRARGVSVGLDLRSRPRPQPRCRVASASASAAARRSLEHARLYSLPEHPPPVLLSAFGPKSIALAGRSADGFVTVGPDADAIASYRGHGGAGPISGGLKVCWGDDRDECVRTAHRLWPNEGLSGELAMILPSPRHFEQACELVTPEQISSSVPCGPDPAEHIAAIQSFVDAGFDEIHVGQIGPQHDGFVDFYASEILPHFAG